MRFVVIFGPPAVGKMTVGQALASRAGFKLLHNHVTIDLITRFFPHGSPSFRRLNGELRRRFIEEAMASGLDLIFTYVWAMDEDFDTSVMDTYASIVEAGGGEVFFVELEAPLDLRLVRNRTENRLMHKNKGDFEATESQMRDAERYKLNTAPGEGFALRPNHIKIDTAALSPEEAAARICGVFGWQAP